MTNLTQQTQIEYRIMRLKQVLECTGLARSTVYDLLNPKSPRHDPSFPKSIQLTPGSVGWIAAEIYAWIDLRISISRA